MPLRQGREIDASRVVERLLRRRPSIEVLLCSRTARVPHPPEPIEEPESPKLPALPIRRDASSTSTSAQSSPTKVATRSPLQTFILGLASRASRRCPALSAMEQVCSIVAPRLISLACRFHLGPAALEDSLGSRPEHQCGSPGPGINMATPSCRREAVVRL